MEPVMIKNKLAVPEATWLALRQKLWPRYAFYFRLRQNKGTVQKMR